MAKNAFWVQFLFAGALCVGGGAYQEASAFVPNLPKGFEAKEVATDLGALRHMAIRDNGDIYIRLSEAKNGKGIVAIRDQNADGTPEKISYFTETTGTGIEIYDNALYYSSDTAIYRQRFANKKELLPSGKRELVLGGFPKQNSHAAKAFSISPDGRLYVNVGAPSNACQKRPRTPGSPGMRPCPQLELHASVWSFSAKKLNQSFPKDGEKFASGLRNIVAMAWHPNFNKIYVVQHGRDQLHTLFPDHYSVKENADLPAEEFFLLEKGFVGGWPYTYWDPFKKARMLAPEYGGDGKTKAKDDQFPAPLYSFPAHWAPNDLLFYTAKAFPERYQNGAFVAFHGSWNRAPLEQAGFVVAFLANKGGAQKWAQEHQIFADGFQAAGGEQGQIRYRPMGLALAPDGALYLVDSRQGSLWRLSYGKNP